MKKTTLSILTICMIHGTAMAGNDTTPVEAPVTAIPMMTQSVFYVGLGLSAVSNREASLDFFDVTNGQDRTGDVTVLAGYKFNPYVAVEGRYMKSITQEDILERDSWGIYVKPQYPITESINLYALLGYGGYNAEGTTNTYSIDVDDTGFQWGFGVDYELVENVSVFVDYLNIANDVGVTSFINTPANVSSDALTVGVTYTF